MKHNTNENAVSPIIGVILLVAITVILAAIVAAFVFGMSSDQKPAHLITVTTSYNHGNIEMVYSGGDGKDMLDHIEVTLNEGPMVSWTPDKVGEMNTFTGTSKPTKAMIVAFYKDNSQYVVMDGDI